MDLVDHEQYFLRIPHFFFFFDEPNGAWKYMVPWWMVGITLNHVCL